MKVESSAWPQSSPETLLTTFKAAHSLTLEHIVSS